MIAALQMYDWPEIQPRLDAFWTRIAGELRDQGIEAPKALSRPESIASAWTVPDLLLGQTCGLPYVSGRCGTATLVARPDFGLTGAVDGTYSSVLICRSDDAAEGLAAFKGKSAAINEFGSQSGCNALADAVLDVEAGEPFFENVVLSGAHRESARLVADGACDIAAIDAVAWALFTELEQDRHRNLRVLCWTRPMPALPFITGMQSASLVDSLYSALETTCDQDGTTPTPKGIFKCSDGDYDPIRAMAARVAGMRLAKNSPALGKI